MSTTSNRFDSQPQDQTSLKTGPGQQQGYVQQAYDIASKASAAAAATASNVYNTVAGTAANAVDPTTNFRNHQQHVGGVGDLGTISTDDVVRLPEERANPDPLNPPERQFRNHQVHIGGVGDLGTRSEVDVVRLPEERANPDPYSSTSRNLKDTTVGNAATDAKNKVVGAIDTKTPTTAAGRRASAGESSSPTSPSRKDKIKGKLLVAEGKLMKNADKVEQGKVLQGLNPTA
ncbi:hypothetical protein M407DRAFT_241887 [Tulasnella calospora MUT 4182]|uniref:Uncharacterized protein n=1 Tax=Tulasnella calospora MUT 4182 TaxID=1051891 RepID=A0A0C3QR81_9AGAM|nr:hypothetical protein M407DRAFT_241887 [Tulasnella calospora MUT 4182]